MTTRAEISRKNKYWIDKYRYRELQYFCLQYPAWRDKVRYGAREVVADGMPHGTGTGKPTEAAAIANLPWLEKMRIVENTAKEVDSFLAPYLLRDVTDGNISYNYLRTVMNMPCGRRQYYIKRREFFWRLSEKI